MKISQLCALCALTTGLAFAPSVALGQMVEPNSKAAEVLAMATGAAQDATSIDVESAVTGPSVGGNRSTDAVAAVRKSQIPRMFEPGTHHYRPHFLVPSPISSTRPSTFNQRHVSWRLGYVSDGFRGSYFR